MHLLKQTLPLRKADPHGISDIYSAKKYQQLVKLGRLGELHQISMNVFFDGMVKNKEQQSIYLLWGCINELPISERFKSENLVLLGVWCHPFQPSNCVIAPFVHQLRWLQQTIVPVVVGDSVKAAQCSLMAFITDFVCRAKVTKIMQFNGCFGCPKCLQKGEQVDITNYYPFVASHLRPLRTHDWMLNVYDNFENLVSAAQIAPTKKLYHFKGVKGFSVLSLIPNFDVIEDVCLEFQHQLYINICSNLYNLTIAKFCNKQYLNKVLAYMKIPREFKTWNLDLDFVHKWSAIDWRYFLTYYWTPVMHQSPKDLSDSHWKLWTTLIYINWCVSGKYISNDLLHKLDDRVEEFVKEYEAQFGLSKMTINIHTLLHIPRDIQRFGMGWTHSAWAFESENGIFGRGIHGNRVYLLERLKSYEEKQEFSAFQSKKPKELRIQHKKIAATTFYITRPKQQTVSSQDLLFPTIPAHTIKQVKTIAYFYDNCGARFDAEWHSMSRFSCNCGIRIQRGNTEDFAVIQQIYVVKASQTRFFLKVAIFTTQLIQLAYYSAFLDEPSIETLEIDANLKISNQIQFKLGRVRYFTSRIEETTPTSIRALESRAALSMDVEGIALGVTFNAEKQPQLIFTADADFSDLETPSHPILIEQLGKAKENLECIWVPVLVTGMFQLLCATYKCCFLPSYPFLLPSLLDRSIPERSLKSFFNNSKSQILFWPLFNSQQKEWELLLLTREGPTVFMFLYCPCGLGFFEEELTQIISDQCNKFKTKRKALLIITEPPQEEIHEGGFLIYQFASAICKTQRFPTPNNIYSLLKKGGMNGKSELSLEDKLSALKQFEEDISK